MCPTFAIVSSCMTPQPPRSTSRLTPGKCSPSPHRRRLHAPAADTAAQCSSTYSRPRVPPPAAMQRCSVCCGAGNSVLNAAAVPQQLLQPAVLCTFRRFPRLGDCAMRTQSQPSRSSASLPRSIPLLQAGASLRATSVFPPCQQQQARCRAALKPQMVVWCSSSPVSAAKCIDARRTI